jgi:hypothetical protein
MVLMGWREELTLMALTGMRPDHLLILVVLKALGGNCSE